MLVSRRAFPLRGVLRGCWSGKWFSSGTKRVVDLRSDTVTAPNAEMIIAMMDAKVGDDVMGEDLAVRELEEKMAQKLGKEAGLFVPSGTMGNLAAIGVHCARGTEVILGTESHIFRYEGAGASAYMGVGYFGVENASDGTLPVSGILDAIRDREDAHYPHTALVALENSQNRCQGAPLTAAYTAEVGKVCAENGLKLHVDGARLFNSAAALGVEAAALVEAADSVSVCLSKGLACPVGSVLVGSEAFVAQARRIRKSLGGGMRQSGVVAACGVVALEKHVPMLAQDNARAKTLARGLASIPGILLDPRSVKTNIVYFDLDPQKTTADAATLIQRLGEKDIKLGQYGTRRLRAVTHLQIYDKDIERTLDTIQDILQDMQS